MLQYALAGAYIAERADVLIAVWDGAPARGTGGTGDIVAWRDRGEIPAEYATPAVFAGRPQLIPAVVVRPVP
jgi:hypothetical protein